MAEEFDPSWEYYTADPEIAELLEVNPPDIDQVFGSMPRGETGGFRFGRGNPNFARFRLAPEPPESSRIIVQPVVCAGCSRTFTPDRNGRRYCSNDCYVRPGRARTLPAFVGCLFCGVGFRPKVANSQFCSLGCHNFAQRAPVYSVGCPNCGSEVVPSGRGRSSSKVYCSTVCKKSAVNKRWRRKGESSVTLEDAKSMITSGVVFGDVFGLVPEVDRDALRDWFCHETGLPNLAARSAKTVSGNCCRKCGGLMVRTGSCETCQGCGESSGGCG